MFVYNRTETTKYLFLKNTNLTGKFLGLRMRNFLGIVFI